MDYYICINHPLSLTDIVDLFDYLYMYISYAIQCRKTEFVNKRKETLKVTVRFSYNGREITFVKYITVLCLLRIKKKKIKNIMKISNS